MNPLALAALVGVVFLDVNGNGVRDAGEPALPNVVVSNQDTVVTTDANGAFRMNSNGTGIVFVSVPDGYRAVGNFWRAVDDNHPLEFGLARVARSDELTFAHASDTHLSPASLTRTQRLRSVVDSLHPDFLIITGDLVRDALRVPESEAASYYELFAHERSLFRTPVVTIPGNHENFGIERDTSHVSMSNPLYGRGMYHHYFGPDYFSFTRAGIHFVGLNTVDIDDQHYYGHVDSLQLEWLTRDLATIPANMPVVSFDHIPFFTTFESINGYDDKSVAPTVIVINGKPQFRHVVANAADVLAVLRTRRHVLALGGHIHGTERIEYEIAGVKTRFNQIAATIAAPRGAGLQFLSGVTVYHAKRGEIDGGTFVPLDPKP